ncbi:prohibitin-3, mitochondrial-like [Coffea arabica]|uniref:Prohibitin n=1 Tax=Coffea arabica TaxID=13443 RepID=A0ABM4UTQ4_COFAR
MGSSQVAVSFLANIARAAFGLGIGTTVLNSSLYIVDGGQRAVLFDRFRSVIDDTIGEGTHFLIPWLQKPFIFDIRTRPHTFFSISDTKDIQMVKPEVSRLPNIFKTLGLEYDEKVLPSIGNEVLKAVVAQLNADQLLTERPHVSTLVRDSLVHRAKDFNIVLDDVAITHLSYGAEFSKAVEQKQVAQQEAKRSKFVVMKAGKNFSRFPLDSFIGNPLLRGNWIGSVSSLGTSKFKAIFSRTAVVCLILGFMTLLSMAPLELGKLFLQKLW